MDLTAILEAVIALCAAACARYAIPWLREKLGAEKTKSLMEWAAIGVRAAEQIYGGGGGKTKFRYVRELLENRGFSLDADALKAAIENAVFAMNGDDVIDYSTIQEGP